MAFHHYNRLLDHWQPKVKPEGQRLEFGSRLRYKSLKPGSIAVAEFIAGHLNRDTNKWAISQRTLEKKLGLTKSTISNALEELVAWGIFTRERSNYDKPYTYKLAIECPANCERLADHNTPSELATLPKKQATPSPNESTTTEPKEQATGVLKNRQLIETYREKDKEMNNRQPCFNCSGDFEVLPNGNREIIHSHDCAQLLQIKRGQAWNITQGELGSNWESLDNREQQIANYLSLAKGKDRVAKRLERNQVTTQEQSLKFQKTITRTLAENDLDNYSPNILKWLRIVYESKGEINESHIKRAVDYSKQGLDLIPGGEWTTGVMINSDHFKESLV